MLKITIPKGEQFNNQTQEFVYNNCDTTICLEHSLVSISKWESKWHKPFLVDDQKRTQEEMIDYIRCMTITQNVNDELFYFVSNDNIKQVNEYINNAMTATTFSSIQKQDGAQGSSRKKEIITSEIIYYWMITYQIPMECQKWHLNRLLTLIKVCNIKNNQNNKMSKKDTMANNRALNEARRMQHNTRG